MKTGIETVAVGFPPTYKVWLESELVCETDSREAATAELNARLRAGERLDPASGEVSYSAAFLDAGAGGSR